MDFSAISTAPVISVIVILFLIGALTGYLVGSKKESDRRELALKEADNEKAKAISQLTSDHEENIRVLNKANSNGLEKLEQAQKDEIQKLTDAQQKLVDSLKEGHLRDTEQVQQQHGKLIAQLNDSNLSNARELQLDYEARVTQLEDDNKKATEALKRDHAIEIQTARTDAENKIAELSKERSELQDTLAELEAKIKEDRKNNTFSMSKSGDRLMSVVRSVQELANELDTTSKTVTAGEYSFFNELKDSRNKETVLSLGDSEEKNPDSGDGAESVVSADEVAEEAAAVGENAEAGEDTGTGEEELENGVSKS